MGWSNLTHYYLRLSCTNRNFDLKVLVHPPYNMFKERVEKKSVPNILRIQIILNLMI